jgi:hypothetical protein
MDREAGARVMERSAGADISLEDISCVELR